METKNIWTNKDFENMGWHDNYIHAISFGSDYEFLLDIDYILKWVSPEIEGEFFTFCVSPCTLIFENVHDLILDISINKPFELQIDEVNRNDSVKQEREYEWLISTNQGDITFKSTGYKQFVRQKPIVIDHQMINHSKRGGISFNRQAVTL